METKRKAGRPVEHLDGTVIVPITTGTTTAEMMKEIAVLESSDVSKTWSLAARQFIEKYKKENEGIK